MGTGLAALIFAIFRSPPESASQIYDNGVHFQRIFDNFEVYRGLFWNAKGQRPLLSGERA
jgi:hypothetical protein